MIEKFTQEELDIIRKELEVLDRGKRNKQSFVYDDYTRLRNYTIKMMSEKNSPLSTKAVDIRSTIYKLCDLITENYEQSQHPNKFRNFSWKTLTSVLPEKQEHYKEVYKKLVNLFIEENSKIHEKTEV